MRLTVDCCCQSTVLLRLQDQRCTAAFEHHAAEDLGGQFLCQHRPRRLYQPEKPEPDIALGVA
jgi:hypothetical protein